MKLKYFLLAAVMVVTPTMSLAADDFAEPALTSDEIIEAVLDESAEEASADEILEDVYYAEDDSAEAILDEPDQNALTEDLEDIGAEDELYSEEVLWEEPALSETEESVEESALVGEGGVSINEINFPDDKFREFVKQYDTTPDGILSEEEIAAVTGMTLGGDSFAGNAISSVEGIKNFTSLNTLLISDSCGVKEIDVIFPISGTPGDLLIDDDRYTVFSSPVEAALNALDSLSEAKIYFDEMADLPFPEAIHHDYVPEALCDDDELPFL